MQGKKEYQQELFSYVDLERLVPSSHLLRRIDKVLKVGFIREMTRDLYSQNGRPSIDPEVFFRIQLIGYIYGIESDRQLCEEVSLNVAYRWFCKLSMHESVLDHSSLTRITDRFGEKLYEKVFIEIVKQCKAAGLVRGKRVIIDATLVQADASLKTMVPNSGQDEFDSKGGRKLSNQSYTSRVDPDSQLVRRKNGGKALCHKVHYAADAKDRVITSVMVTPGNVQDHEKLIDQIEYCRGELQLPVAQVSADKGYGVASNYQYLSKQGITAYIPLRNDRHQTKAQFGIKFNRQKNTYSCPGGSELTARWHDHKRERTLYKSPSQVCGRCHFKSICPLSKHNDCEARLMWTSFHEGIFRKIRKRSQTPYFKSVMTERSWKIEGLFAEAKKYCGMQRARYRGRAKMQIQAYMAAIVQNLKRLGAKTADFIHIHILRLVIWPNPLATA